MVRRLQLRSTVSPTDTTWTDTDGAFEEEPVHVRSRVVARESKCGHMPDLYAGPSTGVTGGDALGCSKPLADVRNHAHVARVYFHAEVQRPVLVRLAVEDQRSTMQEQMGSHTAEAFGNATGSIISSVGNTPVDSAP